MELHVNKYQPFQLADARSGGGKFLIPLLQARAVTGSPGISSVGSRGGTRAGQPAQEQLVWSWVRVWKRGCRERRTWGASTSTAVRSSVGGGWGSDGSVGLYGHNALANENGTSGKLSGSRITKTSIYEGFMNDCMGYVELAPWF